jgi:hypothetical protein
MKRSGFFAALAALGFSTAAEAQDAGAAFGCALPYRDTMMAMGSLEMLGQTELAPFPGLHGGGQRISFTPGSLSVLGAKPEMLFLEILQPHPTMGPKKYRVSFTAAFANTPENDNAIQNSVDWHIGCGALTFCQNTPASRPAGGGRIEYRREAKLSLQCIFEFTPEEFEALGE